MFRRRRRAREVAFSFDSFLDLVTNVVGIIIRLILVAWVGARSYSSLQGTSTAVARTNPAHAEADDPLRQELGRHRRELDEAQARLLDQLRQLRFTAQDEKQAEQELAGLDARRDELDRKQGSIDRATAATGEMSQAAVVTRAELQERQWRLADEIRAMAQLPPLKKVLRYRTPVSRPVHTAEFHFECREGRVAFVDIASLLADVRQGMEEKAKQLRTQWQVTATAGPVGAFRLRYVLERERGTLDAAFQGAPPDPHGTFRYGLSEWEVEPVLRTRGESDDAALAAGSEFRQLVDRIDPEQSVVTFWVYPDSFPLFRRLRDYLYDRDVTVAGRPLPENISITCSRGGSLSRGQ
jgi:multidrug efflux pump subunit AcrA (membrane-fusion protein)